MWSGPRNISTAMMRAWGNRDDTFVCDEPLYAYYLTRHPVAHPGVDEVLAHHETDCLRVVAWLTGPIPEGKTVFYQKQMTHHLLPEIDRGWLADLDHCFLIRDPREMLASLLVHMPEPSIADTGLPQQWEIFEYVRRQTGEVPPVIDARDVLEQPEPMLRTLCARLGLRFSERMLHWAPGRRATDGIWAKHWYASVEQSTGFQPYRPKRGPVPPEYERVAAEAVAYYQKLYAHRITAVQSPT
jgi:hypothetical protein